VNGIVFFMAQYNVALKIMCLSEKMPKMQNFLCAGESWFFFVCFAMYLSEKSCLLLL
jgi:hypothetical protein